MFGIIMIMTVTVTVTVTVTAIMITVTGPDGPGSEPPRRHLQVDRPLAASS
jgi:hypothetical protein